MYSLSKRYNELLMTNIAHYNTFKQQQITIALFFGSFSVITIDIKMQYH